ncbi:MAG TPA: acyl carrier protein [Spirochaetota bacterium]|nr:acyl carrier protein [Spirochaetota bacterium]HPC42943.1 acyl carrier protein [Spirochaetota bacterium]HPL19086.1 acyl carrier protein [Spirochaetota bacterium]HQF07642.1 acyl carrier protein [Spirochaetota bacterium]HQH96373.1 acyl carrier protein [Spirochaetota bacterium]
MAKIENGTVEEVRRIVYEFFSEECEVSIDELKDDTNVIKDLEGDSLMFLELLEIFKKKYGLNVELKTVGKYVVKHPAETIGAIIGMTMLIIEHENRIAELE